ncbi:KNS1 [Symbiodinium natans]|uniref:KNS1 protein n=1 Tax=Symbiodinium natans TaxID=878477 RepID=A0A812R6M7_9DINO|nr:KNS1 [Symbiodinium natans]
MYLEDVRSISEQMCRTLAWLHGKGVLHLDLKPQNFVLESGGYCVTSPPLQASGRVGLWSMEEFRLCCPQPAQDGSACVEAGLASKAYSRPLDVRVRLIDFGMAAYSGKTEPHAMGTWAYRSPEDLLALPLSAKSDIFSCGRAAQGLFL